MSKSAQTQLFRPEKKKKGNQGEF